MKTQIIFAALLIAVSASSLTLLQRSTGFTAIDWEEGHTELELGDVNGDGHLDLLSVGDHGNPNVNSTEQGIICYLGNGAGVWTVHQYGGFGYGGIGLGDLNRDGFMDIAWGIHHDWPSGGIGSKLLGAALGNGTGAFWSQWDDGMPSMGEDWGMFASDLADFDGDGWLDLVSQSFGGSNGIQLYRNLGNGNWSHAFGLPGGSVAYTIETGDFNADGYMDFAGTRTTGSVYLGDGNFGFTANATGITGSFYSVDVGDFDGDGRDDLLIDHGSSGVKAWRLSAITETWEEVSTGLPTFNAEQIQFGDLNGNGHLDVVAYTQPTGRCYLSDGAGTWTIDAAWAMPTPGDGNALRIDGDVDHDGREDIAVLAVKSGFPFYRNQLRVYSPWESPTDLATRVVKPNGGETLRQGSIRDLRWATAVPTGQGPASVDLYLSTSGSTGPWTPVALGIPDNGRYEWRVLAEVSSDCYLEVRASAGGDEAVDRSNAAFAILEGDATDIPEIAGGLAWVGAFPNPAQGRTRLSWNLSQAKPSTLRIFDVQGRLVLSEGIRSESGVLDWTPARDLASGLYFIELKNTDERATGKLLLMR